MEERVLGFIVRRADRLGIADSVDYGGSGGDVKNFHERVVKRVKLGKQIQVARYEDYQEELMSSHRNSCFTKFQKKN